MERTYKVKPSDWYITTVHNGQHLKVVIVVHSRSCCGGDDQTRLEFHTGQATELGCQLIANAYGRNNEDA